MCTFPFFPGCLPAAVGNGKINSAVWAEEELRVRSHDYSSCKYLFVRGFALILVYCIKFLFFHWSPSLAVNEIFAPSPCLLFVGCTHMYKEPFSAFDSIGNAWKYRLSSAHKSKCILANGAWRLRNKMFLCFSSNIKSEQHSFYDFYMAHFLFLKATANMKASSLLAN